MNEIDRALSRWNQQHTYPVPASEAREVQHKWEPNKTYKPDADQVLTYQYVFNGSTTDHNSNYLKINTIPFVNRVLITDIDLVGSVAEGEGSIPNGTLLYIEVDGIGRDNRFFNKMPQSLKGLGWNNDTFVTRVGSPLRWPIVMNEWARSDGQVYTDLAFKVYTVTSNQRSLALVRGYITVEVHVSKHGGF